MSSQLDRIEWKLDMILALLRGGPVELGVRSGDENRFDSNGVGGDAGERRAQLDPATVKAMRGMSLKQHATLQMVLRGASNQEIADRFGVSVNTAKVYLRSISKKLGVHLRTQIAVKVVPVINGLTDEEYKDIARGLPKDWDATYAFAKREDDPFWPHYTGSRVGRGEDDDECEDVDE